MFGVMSVDHCGWVWGVGMGLIISKLRRRQLGAELEGAPVAGLQSRAVVPARDGPGMAGLLKSC